MFTLPFHPKKKSQWPPTPQSDDTVTHDNVEPQEPREEAAAFVPNTLCLQLRPKVQVRAAPEQPATSSSPAELEDPDSRNEEEDGTNRNPTSGLHIAPTNLVYPLPARPPDRLPHPLPARPPTPNFLRQHIPDAGDPAYAPSSLLSHFRHVIEQLGARNEACAIPGYQHLTNVEACAVERESRLARERREEVQRERKKAARDRRNVRKRKAKARKERQMERELEAQDQMQM